MNYDTCVNCGCKSNTYRCADCSNDYLKMLASGICPDHLCSLLERYNEFEGGVSRYCPDCEELALGDIPF